VLSFAVYIESVMPVQAALARVWPSQLPAVPIFRKLSAIPMVRSVSLAFSFCIVGFERVNRLTLAILAQND
jgi:hypothetical protein